MELRALNDIRINPINPVILIRFGQTKTPENHLLKASFSTIRLSLFILFCINGRTFAPLKKTNYERRAEHDRANRPL